MEMKAAASMAAQRGMGAVHIAVTDGDRALRFYRDYVGLTPLDPGEGTIRMGAGNREIVVLHPGAERPVAPHTSGPYHLASLVPARRELARVTARLGGPGWDRRSHDRGESHASGPCAGTAGRLPGQPVFVNSGSRFRGAATSTKSRDAWSTVGCALRNPATASRPRILQPTLSISR